MVGVWFWPFENGASILSKVSEIQTFLINFWMVMAAILFLPFKIGLSKNSCNHWDINYLSCFNLWESRNVYHILLQHCADFEGEPRILPLSYFSRTSNIFESYASHPKILFDDTLAKRWTEPTFLEWIEPIFLLLLRYSEPRFRVLKLLRFVLWQDLNFLPTHRMLSMASRIYRWRIFDGFSARAHDRSVKEI